MENLQFNPKMTQSSGLLNEGGEAKCFPDTDLTTSSNDVHNDDERKIFPESDDIQVILHRTMFEEKGLRLKVFEEIIAKNVLPLESGFQGPTPCSIMDRYAQALGGSGKFVTTNNSESNFVFWMIGSPTMQSAYIFARDDGDGGLSYITYTEPDGPVIFEDDVTFPHPTSLTEKDDLAKDKRVFYLFASDHVDTHAVGYLFPSKFFATRSYSVQETGNHLAYVKPHKAESEMYKII